MHDHAHCDHHRPANYNMAFAVGTALNAAFVAVEFGAGFFTRSLALVADAGHNLGDVLGLLIGWTAATLALKQPTSRRTYGYRRSTILAALTNSSLLMVVVGAVAWEAIERIASPVPIQGNVVMLVATVGIVVNGGTALMFARGRSDDLNIRSAYMHMLMDACVAFGVVLAGLAIKMTGLGWIDSVTSIAIAGLIGIGTWKMLRTSIDLAMDAVPKGIDPDEVRAFLSSIPGVAEIADLHIWAMSTTETALTAHLVVPENWPPDVVSNVAGHLHEQFGIAHSTIQVEQNSTAGCPLVI